MPSLKAGTGKFKIEGQEVRLRVHTNLPANHPFYAMVGRVASEWSNLEHTLDLIIWDLVSFRASGLGANVVACVTSQIMGVAPRCKVIALLASHYHLPEKTVLKPTRKLMSDSYVAADRRARFVHDPWYMDFDTGQPAQFKAMPYSEPEYGYKDITKDALDQAISEIQSLRDRASKLRSNVSDALQAFARKLA